MELFWRNGYDATTLPDLLEAMGGISPPSFYAAFGSKEKVFADSVMLYHREVAGRSSDALAGGATAREAIRNFMYAGVDGFSGRGKPKGCLVVLGGVNCGSASIARMLAAIRQQAVEVLRNRLRRGVAEGDIPKSADVGAMADFYSVTMYGLALSASDGMSARSLRRVVDAALTAWDGLAGVRPPGPTKRRRPLRHL